MIDAFWLALFVKLAVTAVFILATSLVVERSGPFIGAIVATLPVSAGPAYVFLALDHDPAFIAHSALVSLAMVPATTLFALAYTPLAQRNGVAVSLGVALAVWLITAIVTNWFEWTVATAILLNLAAFGLALPVTRRYREIGIVAPFRARWWDMPVRTMAVSATVGTVVVAGHLSGPTAAGTAAFAPVVLTTLAIILHPRLGGPATAAVFANALPGFVSFMLGFATLHLAVIPLGSASALVLALMACLAWSGGLIFVKRRPFG